MLAGPDPQDGCQSSIPRLRGAPHRTQETHNPLARYPRLNAQAPARLIDIFPALPPINKAEIAAAERLSGKLAALSRSQRQAVSVARRAVPCFLPPNSCGGRCAVLAILQPRMIY